MAKKKPAAGTPALTVLTAAGAPHTVHTYQHDPGSDLSYGAEAAAALGVDAARVFKTLIVSVDNRLVVGVVPVTGSLDLKAIAQAVGGKKAEMAATDRATRSSGYVLGGISPLGQRTPLPTVLDASAMAHPSIFVSAGRRGSDVELTADTLITLTGALTAPISRTA
ncbi:MAG: Cys-tRNA(Pro) deacylase [Mycetocola sp.]